MSNPWHQPHTNTRFIPANPADSSTPWHFGWTVKQQVATIDPNKGIDCHGRYNFWYKCEHEWDMCSDGKRRVCGKCMHDENIGPPALIYIPDYKNESLLKENGLHPDQSSDSD